jgi:hypothetical protein
LPLRFLPLRSGLIVGKLVASIPNELNSLDKHELTTVDALTAVSSHPLILPSWLLATYGTAQTIFRYTALP